MADAADSLGTRIRSLHGPTWTGYVISSIAALGVTVLLTPAGAPTQEYVRGFALYLILMASAAGWMFLLRTLWRRSATSISGIMAALLASGAILGWAIGFVGGLLSLTEPTPPIIQIPTTAAVLTWWVLTVELLLDSRRRQRRSAAELNQQSLTLDDIAREQADLVSTIRAELQREVSAVVQPAITSIDARLRVEHDQLTSMRNTDLVELIHTTARESLRPLSRRWWQAGQNRNSPPRPARFLRRIISTAPFQPLAVVMIYAVTSLPERIGALGVTAGTIEVALSITVIAAVMLAANRLMRMFPRKHAVLFLATITLLQLPVLVALWVDADDPGGSRDAGSTAAAIVVGVIVIIGTSALGNGRADHLATLEAARSSLEQDRWELQTQRRATQQLLTQAARDLHGGMQTRLTAAALALKRADELGDSHAIDVALVQAREALTAPLPGHPAAAPSCDEGDGAITAEIAEVTRPWSGLCEITVTIEPEGAVHARARAAALVVEEAVANAIRHGDAEHIEVKIQVTGPGLRITVNDDGDSSESHPAGLGSALFDEVTERWSRTSNPSGGSTLAAVVADSTVAAQGIRENDA